ncbi:MAG: adenylyltransferase/cytidyltransferase family protein [Pseudothermotoga sp.]
MRTVLTYGSFDLFHIGHLNFLQKARDFGDRLVVGVTTDEFDLLKGKVDLFNYEERAKVVESIKYVDEIFPAKGWEEKIEDIEKYKPHVIVASEEWREKYEPLRKLCRVEFLPRTQGISSSRLRHLLNAIEELTATLESLPINERQEILTLIREKLHSVDRVI